MSPGARHPATRTGLWVGRVLFLVGLVEGRRKKEIERNWRGIEKNKKTKRKSGGRKWRESLEAKVGGVGENVRSGVWEK